jgi:hypothetical protein
LRLEEIYEEYFKKEEEEGFMMGKEVNEQDLKSIEAYYERKKAELHNMYLKASTVPELVKRIRKYLLRERALVALKRPAKHNDGSYTVVAEFLVFPKREDIKFDFEDMQGVGKVKAAYLYKEKVLVVQDPKRLDHIKVMLKAGAILNFEDKYVKISEREDFKNNVLSTEPWAKNYMPKEDIPATWWDIVALGKKK